MYKITMRKDYYEVKFAFANMEDAAEFMDKSLTYSTDKIFFEVDIEKGEE